MTLDFKKLMSGKTDKEIDKYLFNINKFTSDAGKAALAEAIKRGREFSEQELAKMHCDLDMKVAQEKGELAALKTNAWTKNVVKDDETLPAYFSQQSIYIFTILFSVLFGSVLMGSNLYHTEHKKVVVNVVLFGIVYTTLQIWLLSLIPRNTIFVFAASGLGAIILNGYFWKQYIGAETKYRSKPIWIPLAIAIAILIPIAWVVFNYSV